MMVSLPVPMQQCKPVILSRCLVVGYQGTGGNQASPLYFMAAVAVGVYMLMTLFITILLERFSGQGDNDFSEEACVEEVREALVPSPICTVRDYSNHPVPCRV